MVLINDLFQFNRNLNNSRLLGVVSGENESAELENMELRDEIVYTAMFHFCS